MNQWHEGGYCYVHVALHLDEPVEELRLDPRNLPTPAVRELARAGW